MKLYLDTEFTDLVPGARLISIALVSETGEYFYAELTDTYKIEHCSDFVKAYVLPLLRGGNYSMTRSECVLKLADWIESFDERCVVVSDAPSWDMPFLTSLMSILWPSNLEKYCLMTIVCRDVLDEIVVENSYDIHNALDDALALMKGASKVKN
jgi:hypothetical protein